MRSATLDQLRNAALRERDLDHVEVARYDRLGEDRARLARDLRAEVAVRQMREREQADIPTASDLGCLRRGLVQRLRGAFAFLVSECRLGDEHVGAPGGLDD